MLEAIQRPFAVNFNEIIHCVLEDGGTRRVHCARGVGAESAMHHRIVYFYVQC